MTKLDTSKTDALIGASGRRKLDETTVMIIGLGGVGSSCAEVLARSGIGALILIDFDDISPSNLNRQVIAFQSTIGKPKVDVCRAFVKEIDPDCKVNGLSMKVMPEDVAGLLDEHEPDFVIDAQDTIATKIEFARCCNERNLPFLSSMGAGNKFRTDTLRFSDISETSYCPLCKVMRKECARRGIGPLRVLYSTEKPVELPLSEDGVRGDRSNIATMSYLPSIMGRLLAADCIQSVLDL